jgi:large subunit ribosomal protein L53
VLRGSGQKEGEKLMHKTEDGKEMNIDLADAKINDIVDQVDRHSRILARKDALSG